MSSIGRDWSRTGPKAFDKEGKRAEYLGVVEKEEREIGSIYIETLSGLQAFLNLSDVGVDSELKVTAKPLG